MMTKTFSHDGTWSFALGITKYGDASPAGTLLFAPSDAYYLTFIRQGQAVVCLSGLRYACHGPALFFGNEREQMTLEKSENLEAWVVGFHPGIVNDRFQPANLRLELPEEETTLRQDRYFLRPFIERSDDWTGFMEAGLNMGQDLTRLIGRMETQLVGQPDFWPCRARSYLLEMLFIVGRLFEDGPSYGNSIQVLPQTDSAAEPVLLFLDAHYMEEHSLESLASRFGTNRTTLNQRFQNLCGMTVKNYVIARRLRFASLLLRDTALPVSEVMERSGFCDQTHFSRMFRRNFGLAPSEYRNLNGWVKA